MRRLQSPGADAVPDGLLHCSLAREIEGRRHARDFAVHGLEVLAPAQVALAQATDDGDAIARGQEAAARILRAVVHQADHPDHRRREHRLAFGLVVERDVARHHRRLQGRAGVRDPQARLLELPHDLRALRVAEVQAVGDRERLASDARDVARRFRHGVRRAETRIEVAPAGVAPDGNRHSAVALAGEPHHRCIALAGPDGGPDADHVIVLAVHPLLGSHGWGGEHRLQRGHQVSRLRHFPQLLHFVLPGRPPARSIVRGSIVGERRDRELGDGVAAALHHQLAGIGDAADDRVRQVPLVADVEDFLLATFLRHQQHPLLRFAEHHLVGRHSRLATWDGVDVQLEPAARARGHLDRRGGEPRRAHVLDPDQAIRLEQLQAGLEQELLHERVPDLHRRPLALALLVEFRARHRGAVDAIAAGARADVDHRVPDAARRAAEDPVRFEQPEGEGVHQAVAVERCVQGDLACDRGNADAVAVSGDPGDHSLEQPCCFRMGGIAESERVHRGDRPRSHGEHVAEDAADSRCGALVRLDVARMVVALHLERDGQAATDIDHAGVLTGTLQHPRTLRGEVPEQATARLVRAVLAPHG